MPYFIKKHYQPLLAGALLLVGLLVFGVIQLIDDGKTQAERLKNLGDRYYNSHDIESAVRNYEWALEADPAYEEVYIILHNHYAKEGDSRVIWDLLVRAVENTDSEILRELHENADFPIEGEDYEIIRRILIHMSYLPHNFKDDLWSSNIGDMTQLFIYDEMLEDLKILRYFKNLEVLYVSGRIDDYSYIGEMTKLVILTIRPHKMLYDISFLSELTSLRSLQLDTRISIEDFSPLANLRELENLHIKRNFVGTTDIRTKRTDLSPLAELGKLVHLEVRWSSVEDITPLAELTNLRSLNLLGNLITDISPLTGLNKLDYLDLIGNPITDFSPLDNMKIMEVYYDNPGIH
jgi:internalin A